MFSLYLLFILLLTTFSLLVLCFSLYKKLNITEQRQKPELTHLVRDPNPANPGRETEQPVETVPAKLPRSARSLLLRLLPSDSPKWERLFEEEGERESDPDSAANRAGPEEEQRGKRKKRRARKKSGSNPKDRDETNGDEEEEEEGFVKAKGRGEREELVCLYPFTSSSSATQRKIKQHYDELMKCHHAKGLTFVQVGEFANCLVEAKNELQHKADVIQRKFTITKALLFKADRSSFDRLRQQIYKLELEQKRLEEDACVYNWLQQQLKLSPAYKKMLEIGTRMELKAKSRELIESTDAEYSDISFEELLAQEKKDSFWQRNGKLRPCSG